jgi:hypothetical protein
MKWYILLQFFRDYTSAQRLNALVILRMISGITHLTPAMEWSLVEELMNEDRLGDLALWMQRQRLIVALRRGVVVLADRPACQATTQSD